MPVAPEFNATRMPSTFRLSTLLTIPVGIAVAIAMSPAIDACAGWLLPNVLDYENGVYWGVDASGVHAGFSTLLFHLDSLIVLAVVTTALVLVNATLSDCVAIATLLLHPINELWFALNSSPFSDRYSFTRIWWSFLDHSWIFACIATLAYVFWFTADQRTQWGTPRIRFSVSICLVGLLLFGSVAIRRLGMLGG